MGALQAASLVRMALTVFYSWQTDLPSKVNRNFIEDALKRALRQITAEAEVVNSARGAEVVLDKDTAGLPGTPPIVQTIFSKIDQCAVFVPDLTFVAETSSGRLTPNANVLIEYGWALKSRGYQRIVPVMNDAFGEPSETNLPFNMRHLRWPLRYTLHDRSDADRPAARRQLADELASAIRTVLESTLVEAASGPEFEATPSTYDKAVFFQPRERLATRAGRVADEEFFVPEQGPKMFLRLVPTIPTEPLSKQEALACLREARLEPFALHQITGGEFDTRNKYGAVRYRPARGGPEIEDLTQVLKNRELWGLSCGLLRYQSPRVVPYYCGDEFEYGFIHAFGNYLQSARDTLGLDLPLRLMAGITGIDGYRIYYQGGFDTTFGRAHEPDIVFETMINSWDTSPEEALIPFFEQVWDEFGLERQNFVRS